MAVRVGYSPTAAWDPLLPPGISLPRIMVYGVLASRMHLWPVPQIYGVPEAAFHVKGPQILSLL